jgi:protein-disulfide isomerase
VGGAERNARKKKQAARAVVQARKSGGDRTKVIIGVVAVVVLAIAVIGGVLLSRKTEPQALTPAPDLKAVNAPVQRDGGAVVVGKDTAKVTVDLYEDFLCPICGTFEKKYAAQLKEQVEAGTIKVRYHVLPMLIKFSNPEGYSRDSANAALCAADAGKFAEYHDSLYAKQPEEGGAGYTKAELAKLGTDLGITGDTFKSCVDSGANEQAAQTQLDQAKATSYFSGTPTVAVDGQKIDLDNENWVKDLVKS